MHHQDVPLKNAPPKRTLLTSSQRSSNFTLHQIWCGLWGQQLLAGVVPQGTSEKRSKEYVLMVHFFVVRLMVHQGPANKLRAPHGIFSKVLPVQMGGVLRLH